MAVGAAAGSLLKGLGGMLGYGDKVGGSFATKAAQRTLGHFAVGYTLSKAAEGTTKSAHSIRANRGRAR